VRTDRRLLAFGETVRVTVEADRPVPGGAGVRLEWAPPDALFGGGFLNILDGEVRASVDLVAGEAAGEVAITARLAGNEAVAAATRVEVVEAFDAGALLVNEVHYDQPGDDAAEFVEIFNASGEAAPLAPYRLELVNGANGSVYGSVSLGDAGEALAAGGFLVVGAEAVLAALPEGVLRLPLPGVIQDGAPDAVRIVAGDAHVDGLAYGGHVEGAGEGEPAAEPDLPDALGRCPNGRDSNDNAGDFRAIVPTPGSANGCP
jgi:hypothetical protein